VVDGTVYVGSSDESLYAVDAATGDEEWVFTEPNHEIRSSPTIVNGSVYVGGSPFGDGTLYAVDADTGEEEWVYTEPANGIEDSPSVVDGIVYTTGSDGTVYAVDAETGEKEWSYTYLDAEVSGRTTVANGTVYVGSDSFSLYALDAETGDEEWTIEYEGVISAPVVVDGTVYAGAGPYNDAGPLFAVDAETGDEEWTFQMGDGVDQNSAPTVANGTVYVASEDTTLYAVDAATGDEEWAFTEPSERLETAPTVANGTVYISSITGKVFAVNADTGEQEWVLDDFDDPNSATVVENPDTGNSIDSRVNVGTLGHHDVWAEEAALNSTTARFEFSPQAPTEGDIVEFDASPSSAETGTLSYEWEFGDGATGQGEVIDHTYDAADEYQVSLTVTDGSGATDTRVRSLLVEQASDGEQPSVEAYAGTDGTIETNGLLEAIEDWRNGDTDTGVLLNVIQAWRSNEVIA